MYKIVTLDAISVLSIIMKKKIIIRKFVNVINVVVNVVYFIVILVVCF